MADSTHSNASTTTTKAATCRRRICGQNGSTTSKVKLTIRFQLARPRDKDDDFDPPKWQWMGLLLPMLSAQEAYQNFLKDQRLKDRIFLEQFGPDIARAFVDLMKMSWVDSNDVEHPLPIDTTLLSNFSNDTQARSLAPHVGRGPTRCAQRHQVHQD